MANIFLSYASTNRSRAKVFAEAIMQHGWTVWWDRDIPYGKTFDQVIEQNLEEARCVIVLWTKESIASKWVITEASDGARREILIPVLLESNLKIPLEFRRMQAANLSDWQSGKPHFEFNKLLNQITNLIGPGKLSRGEKAIDIRSAPSSIAQPLNDITRKNVSYGENQSQTSDENSQPIMSSKLIIATGIFVAISLIGILTYSSVTPNNPKGESSSTVSPKEPADVQFKKGMQQYESMNYIEAAKWFRLAAEQDHVEALNKLGEMYIEGEGVLKDVHEAEKLFQRAAELDNYK